MNRKLIRLTESDLHRIVRESVNRVLNESFKSKKLRDVFNKNNKPHPGSLFYVGEVWPNLHDITDDMIDGVYDSPDGLDDEIPHIIFPDNTTIKFNDKIKASNDIASDKFSKRDPNHGVHFIHNKKYFSRTNDFYNDYMHMKPIWNQCIKDGDTPFFSDYPDSKPSIVKKSFANRAKNRYKELRDNRMKGK